MGAGVVGDAVVGAADGLPGVTVGPAVVRAPVLGLAVVGLALGDPGVTVGLADDGDNVVGVELGDPGDTVGTSVDKIAAGLAVAQS